MRRSIVLAATGLALALTPATVMAHPGPHEGETAGLLHAVTRPDHLLVLLVIVAGIIWAPRLFRRLAGEKWRRAASPGRRPSSGASRAARSSC